MRTKLMVGLAVVALLGFGLVPAAQASAASDPGINPPVADSAKYSSQLVITQNGKTTTTTTLIPRMQSPLGQGPVGASLHCNHAYNFIDGDGTYTIQHACGGSTGPWSFRISSAVCGIVVGLVKEAGMAWTRNGVRQGTQATHTQACSYLYHGTYNPDLDYDHITYSDTFTFAVDGGTGTLRIYGDFTTTGSTCSPTSC